MSTNHPAAPASARAEQLQFLRFLAFFCVYVAHAEVWLFFPFPSANCSTAAVGFFFLLGGFVSGYSSYDKQIRLNAGSYFRNLWKKTARLYPLYFITMLIPVIGSSVLTELAALRPGTGSFQLLKNLLMLQSWFPEGSMSFNGVGWYISTLMFLNLFSLPALWLLGKARKHPLQLYFFAAVILGCWFVAAVYCYLTKSWDLTYWHYVFPPARLWEMLSGIALGYFFRALQAKLRLTASHRLVFTVLEVGALVLWFRWMYVFGSPWRVHILNWLIPNAVLITVFAFGEGWLSRLFRLRPLVILGDISFECFLIHNLLIMRLAVSTPALAETLSGRITGFVFCLLLSIMLSVFVHGTKKPAQKK